MSGEKPTTALASVAGIRLGTEREDDAMEALLPGARAGDYVIRGSLGAGSCGTVYAAEHRMLHRRAAVKVLHHPLASSAERVQRFLREARVVNQIRHPNIVDVFEFGELRDGRPYAAMELLRGSSLLATVASRGRFTPLQACALLEPIAAALGAAHSQGVVHRELTASNVMVLPEDPAAGVKLLDFGIAKLLRGEPGEHVLAGKGSRSPLSLAPEQLRGDPVDARADIYALGVLLFLMLTGRHPFEAEDPAEVARLHLEVPPPRPSAYTPVPPAVEAVVLRCMEKVRDQRFPSAMAVVEALRAALCLAPLDPGLPRKRKALAIYVEVRLSGADDAVLDALAGALDETSHILREGGFVSWLQTGSAVLGVKLLPDDPASARAERVLALGRARSIFALPRATGGDSRLRFAVHLHADTVTARLDPERGGTPEIVGGPLVEPESWVAGDEEFFASPSAVEGLSPEELAG